MDRVYRLNQKMNKAKIKIMKQFYHLWLRIVYSCDIMPGTKIGEGARFPHCGLGVVINNSAVIGENVTISKGVVIGGRGGYRLYPISETMY